MTDRRRARLAVLFGVAALALPEFAAGQGGGPPDTVHYRDRKKDNLVSSARGEVRESARGVDLIVNGKTALSLPPTDVIRVEYGRLPGLSDTLRLRAADLEGRDPRDGKDVAAARAAYADMLKGAGTDAKTRKFLEFREAIWSARVADGKTGPDFEAEAKGAIDKLVTFARSYPQSWEVWPAATAAARLQDEVGRPADAAATWANLGKNPDLPADLRYQARLEEVDVLSRSDRLTAQSVADELAKDRGFPATGPLREKLAVYQSLLKAAPTKEGKPAEVKAVEEVIAKTADPGVRATAHAALGEYYLASGRPREAMWEFLWVETVYNQDRDEVVKAVVRLAKVFEQLGDKDRAEQYREKLPRVKAGA